MSRPKGSRNKKFVVSESLESEVISTQDMTSVHAQVEEKFKNLTPAHDPEREKILLETHRVRRGAHFRESDKVDTSQTDLPVHLKYMPEGSDKRKTIIAAAQAALILGTPENQVALQYGISQATVASWKDTLITVGAIGRRDRLSDMLLAFIEQEFKSLMAMSIATSDEEWVQRQSADQLAHYIAVKSDRLLVLLQAFGRVENTRQQYVQQLEVVDDHG